MFYTVTGERGTVIFILEGIEQIYSYWRENTYIETGGRGTIILGLEGEEHLYCDWREGK